jgi:hypothetical protein
VLRSSSATGNKTLEFAKKVQYDDEDDEGDIMNRARRATKFLRQSTPTKPSESVMNK